MMQGWLPGPAPSSGLNPAVRSGQVVLTALPGIPLIQPGDDLAQVIWQALGEAEILLSPGDLLVLASKIVSKAEGRIASLAEMRPSTEALALAARCQKDPRLVELILRESSSVSRLRPGLLITRHRLGFVCANAGLDSSNLAGAQGAEEVLLLPLDPDASAARLRARLEELAAVSLAVVIADSHGRPHRLGTVGVAIGASGLPALEDWRGRPDLFGRVLQHTEVGLADQVASAASLLLGQAAEGTPVVHLRGLCFETQESGAAALVRPPELDMYS